MTCVRLSSVASTRVSRVCRVYNGEIGSDKFFFIDLGDFQYTNANVSYNDKYFSISKF